MKLLIVLLLSLGVLAEMDGHVLAVDDLNEPFYKLATFGVFENGKLTICLWRNDATWVNGILQSKGDDLVFLKAGDVVISFFKEMNYFKKFRLDALNSTRASFTYWGYRAQKVNQGGQIYYALGRLDSSDVVRLDLTKPNGLLVDYGPNHLELGTGITTRSKN